MIQALHCKLNLHWDEIDRIIGILRDDLFPDNHSERNGQEYRTSGKSRTLDTMVYVLESARGDFSVELRRSVFGEQVVSENVILNATFKDEQTAIALAQDLVITLIRKGLAPSATISVARPFKDVLAVYLGNPKLENVDLGELGRFLHDIYDASNGLSSVRDSLDNLASEIQAVFPKSEKLKQFKQQLFELLVH